MNNINYKYQLDDLPPFGELIILGFQWLIITIPLLLILGNLGGSLHYDSKVLQVNYIQKLFFVTGVILLAQIVWGHGLPLIIGPAAVLMVGIVASQGSSLSSIYSALVIGGIILTFLSITGLFGNLKLLFTPRVVATILILIAFTLTPMIINLILSTKTEGMVFYNLIFMLVFVFSMFIANKYLVGLWKSTLIIWALIIGSIVYTLLFPQEVSYFGGENLFKANFFYNLNLRLTLEPGVLISFLVCFLALSINDLGSIQAVGELLQPDNLEKRITRGVALTGIANVLSGFLGVIGMVNYSLSPGIIIATGCASKYTLIPAALGLILVSFVPKVIFYMGNIPTVITAGMLIYILCSQIASGLLKVRTMVDFSFEKGLIMALPLMLSIIISFLPPAVVATFPPFLRPVLGNGFVVGTIAVLVMEHLIFKRTG